MLFSRSKYPSFVSKSLVPENELAYAGTYSEEKFIRCTQKYIGGLLTRYASGTGTSVFIDQFVPPTNIQRYLRYIPDSYDVKVFLVDRDPIDLYITDKYFFKSSVIPSYDVDIFCEWFLWTRNQAKRFAMPTNVMRVQFEDMIYGYEETRRKICEFIGLDMTDKCRQFLNFDPRRSVNNTQVHKRLRRPPVEEMETIRVKLRQYCYDFPKGGIQPDCGALNMFDC